MSGSGRRWDCGSSGAATTAAATVNTSLGYPRAPTAPGGHWTGGNLAGGTIASGQYVFELLGVPKPSGSTRVPWTTTTTQTDRIIDDAALLPCDIVLGLGQSNERGISETVADLSADVSTALQWIRTPVTDSVSGEYLRSSLTAANDPLDGSTAGLIGSAVAFCRSYIANDLAAGRNLVYVPCSVSNTALVYLEAGDTVGKWAVGGTLYEDAITRALACLAQCPAGSAIVGAFFTQGEMDGANGITAGAYQTAQEAMFAGLRSRLSLPSLPIVVSTIPPFYRYFSTLDDINGAQVSTPSRIAHTACVDTVGMTASAGAHYNAASYRLIGPLKRAALASLL